MKPDTPLPNNYFQLSNKDSTAVEDVLVKPFLSAKLIPNSFTNKVDSKTEGLL